MKGYELKTLFSRSDTDGERKRPNPVMIWILIAAVVFLAVSGFTGRKKKETPEQEESLQTESIAAEDYTAQLEQRLCQTLKKINGAGEVSVFISIDSGGEKILATDRKNSSERETVSESEGSSSQETEENVVLSGQSSAQSPYVVEEKLPAPSGVLVVAEGAGNETVRYEIYEAVKALFDLPAHRIHVSR